MLESRNHNQLLGSFLLVPIVWCTKIVISLCHIKGGLSPSSRRELLQSVLKVSSDSHYAELGIVNKPWESTSEVP
jgi:hypothetical protein